MPKVLLADKLPDDTAELLAEAGFEVENRPGLDPEELKEAVRDVEGIICRSGVELSEDVFQATENLRAVCRAGVGVDNIDIPAASRRGVVVMNTPGANTISTAEHTIALMLALSRNVGPAYISMRDGKWDRKKFTGAELAATTLGIIGLGRVGQAVAARALSFEMRVLGHDPFIPVELAQKLGVELADSIEEVLAGCDYLTVHVPGNDENRGLIGREQIEMMKPEARVINCARGEVVDQEAVVEAVREGRLAGAAFDVYEQEPPEDYQFCRDDRVLATPHLGASTEAAQIAVGTQAASQLVDALQRAHYRNALNITSVSPEEMETLRPLCLLAQKLGKSAGTLNRGRPRSIQVICRGEVAEHSIEPIVNHGVMGVLQSMLGESVNIVSAPHLAEERGMEVTSSSTRTPEAGFTDIVELHLETSEGELAVAGTVFGREHPRIVRIGPFYTEVLPEGDLLIVTGQDKPGMIGSVGETLAGAQINIARMTFGRENAGGDALLALNLDTSCGSQTLEEVRKLSVVDKAVLISL